MKGPKGLWKAALRGFISRVHTRKRKTLGDVQQAMFNRQCPTGMFSGLVESQGISAVSRSCEVGSKQKLPL